jgi:hypothetical protein
VVVLAVVEGVAELVDDEEQATSASDAKTRAAAMALSRRRLVMISRPQGGVERC